MKKELLLTAAGIILLTGFFMLPENNQWLQKRYFPYWNALGTQMKHTDPEYRKVQRYGNAYVYSRLIGQFFKNRGINDKVLVLLPPTEYFKKYGLDYDVPEPAVFYYYTGVRTIAPNSPDAMKAGWYAAVRNKQIYIDSFSSQQSVIDSINSFKRSLK